MIKHICIFFSVLIFLNFPIFGQNIYKANAGLELVPLVESFLYKNSYYVEANGKYQFLNKTFFNLGGGIVRRELDNGYQRLYNTTIQGHFYKFGLSRNFKINKKHIFLISLGVIISTFKMEGITKDTPYLDTLRSFSYVWNNGGGFELKFINEYNLSENILLNTGFFIAVSPDMSGSRVPYIPGFRRFYNDIPCSLGLSICIEYQFLQKTKI